MSKSVETSCSCCSLRKSVHELCVNDRAAWDIVRVNAHHLLLLLLVNDHIVDCCLGSCTCCCRKCNGRNCFLLCRSYALKRNDISKFRVVDNDTDTLCSIHSRTTTDSDHEVSTRSLESIYTHLYVLDCRIWLYLAIYLIRDTCLIEYICNHLCYTELDKSLVGYYECLLETETAYYIWELFSGTWAKI